MTAMTRPMMRAQMDEQRALARRLLDEMNHPTPVRPEVAAKAAAFGEKYDAWLDEADSHYVKPKFTYSAAGLVPVEEGDGGCLLWTGDFDDDRKGADSREYPVTSGAHEMCGHSHLWVARAFFEEALGRVLAIDEKVYPTCETNAGKRRPCVAPAHHRLAGGLS